MRRGVFSESQGWTPSVAHGPAGRGRHRPSRSGRLRPQRGRRLRPATRCGTPGPADDALAHHGAASESGLSVAAVGGRPGAPAAHVRISRAPSRRRGGPPTATSGDRCHRALRCAPPVGRG